MLGLGKVAAPYHVPTEPVPSEKIQMVKFKISAFLKDPMIIFGL